jgi:hypothetical protein
MDDDIDAMIAAKRAVQEETRDANQWEPEAGEKIVGILTRAEIVPTRRGQALILSVKNLGDPTGGIKTGETGSFWGSRTVLRGELMREAPALGATLAIQFDGKVSAQGGGNSYYGYVVIVVDPDDDPSTRDRELWTNIEAQLEPKTRGPMRSTKEATDEDGKPNYF